MNDSEDIILLLIQSLSTAWQIESEIQYYFLSLKQKLFIFDFSILKSALKLIHTVYNLKKNP